LGWVQRSPIRLLLTFGHVRCYKVGVRRYFFHLETFGTRSPDAAGTLLPDTQAVVAEALQFARFIMAGRSPEGTNGWQGWFIVVIDEVGNTVFELPFVAVHEDHTARPKQTTEGSDQSPRLV
jgi:hypothetical protein